MLRKLIRYFSKRNLKKYSLIFLGVIFWSLVMVRSGLCWDAGCSGGIGFWGANGHDGIWHISLIQSLSRGSFQMPIFAGEIIQNYHIGFDLLMSWIVRLTGVSASFLYFQITPPIFALLIGILVYKFVSLWKGKHASAMWSLFFVYFGGSFGWIVSLFRGQGWGGESMFWSQQSISTLINPPFALSLITMLSGMIFLTKYLHKKTWINFLGTFLLFGITIFIKVYAGLLILTALFAVSVWHLIKNKDLSLLGGFVISLAISAVLFILFNKSSVSLISFAPFWFLESMMALSDRVGWQKFYSAMTTYRMGNIWGKAIIAYLAAFLIFVVGNFGTRVLAIKSFFRQKINIFKIEWLSVFLLILILAGVVVPTFFVQKGTAWNTIQFLYYSLFFAGIVAGVEVGKLIKRKNIITKSIIAGALVLFTIPTTVSALGNYVSKAPQSVLPKSEKDALAFLKEQPNGTVLTYPYHKDTISSSPTPLYLYTTTAYVSAYSGKPVFLEDEMNLGIMQYSFEERRNSIESFLNTLDETEAYKFLRDNNITYVYWLKDQRARVGDKQLGLSKIYDNGDVKIFKVN